MKNLIDESSVFKSYKNQSSKQDKALTVKQETATMAKALYLEQLTEYVNKDMSLVFSSFVNNVESVDDFYTRFILKDNEKTQVLCKIDYNTLNIIIPLYGNYEIIYGEDPRNNILFEDSEKGLEFLEKNSKAQLLNPLSNYHKFIEKYNPYNIHDIEIMYQIHLPESSSTGKFTRIIFIHMNIYDIEDLFTHFYFPDGKLETSLCSLEFTLVRSKDLSEYSIINQYIEAEQINYIVIDPNNLQNVDGLKKIVKPKTLLSLDIDAGTSAFEYPVLSTKFFMEVFGVSYVDFMKHCVHASYSMTRKDTITDEDVKHLALTYLEFPLYDGVINLDDVYVACRRR